MTQMEKSTPEDGPQVLPEEGTINFDDLLGTQAGLFGVPDKPAEEKVAVTKPQEEKVVDKSHPNDTKRFEYWQREADKAKNELLNVTRQNAALFEKLNAPPALVKEAQVELQQVLEQPKRPDRPAYFNREESLSNPSSDSAKYLDAEDKWRNDMVVYNNDVTKQLIANQGKKIEEFQNQTKAEKEAARQSEAQRAKLSSLATELKTKYNATEEQVVGFMQEMSKPDSLNIDNLWKIYSMSTGTSIKDNKSRSIPANQEPSDEFKQLERSQAVPGTMGVIPGISNPPGKSTEDQLMDAMLSIQKKEDAFNF